MPVTANIEIKLRCRDLGAVRERVAVLAEEDPWTEEQVDTYFHASRGRLKLRESGGGRAELIPYLRSDAAEPRRSDYLRVPVADPGRLRRLLGEILGVAAVVVKTREVWRIDNVRIHLDRVEGLGEFVELEAVFEGDPNEEDEQARRVNALLDTLGLAAAERLSSSYEQLLRERG